MERVKLSNKVVQKYSELFGEKTVNGKKLVVEDVIAQVYDEVRDLWEAALKKRRELLDSPLKVREKYSIPKWDEIYEDPVTGEKRTYREIVQGLIDNFLGKNTPLSWRLNDLVPIPDYAHPLKNPGLEITGPWNPPDMAIKQINADVAATMGPDDEDAAPPDYIPYSSRNRSSIGLFESRLNEKKILAGQLLEVKMMKKGQLRVYKIQKPMEKWPASFHRIPGIHLLTFNVKIDGKPAPSFIVDMVIHALNDFDSLNKAGRMLLFYIPKTQTPQEAFMIAKAIWKLERLMGAEKPGSLIKFKALYEEGNAGRHLPAIMWTWRYWLIGANVGRWDYTASLIEMWKNEKILPDPQNGSRMGMVSPHMMAYQRYNALLNVMAGIKNGELENGAPIGGMAAVMLYQKSDAYGRHRHNAVTLRAMKLDKLRERLIGLIFVPEEDVSGKKITLEDVIKGKVKGKLYDAYRQSWVASPDDQYVAAGNGPLRADVSELQKMLDAPVVWEEQNGEKIAPKVESGLTEDEKKLLYSLGLVDENGKITPWIVTKDMLETPEKFISSEKLWRGKDLWNSLYDIAEGDVTVENIQHAFYMAANYGFQVLNGNLAAAIDDYKAFANRLVRFMNDLATYRIFVSWLWTLANNGAKVTKDGFIKGPKLTKDGVIPDENVYQIKAGTTFDKQMFEKIWEQHYKWTAEFYRDYDRLVAYRLAIIKIGLEGGKTYEEVIQKLDEVLKEIVLYNVLDEDAVKKIASLLNVQYTDSMLKVIKNIKAVQDSVSKAYGKEPTYEKKITLNEAARNISRKLGLKYQQTLEIIKANEPMFDRREAPVIMDILKRQIFSPKYIQHSARVLFSLADKDTEKRRKLLDAIYYLDKNLNPVYRDKDGNPSRDELVKAVKRRKISRDILQIHDYIYDFF
ncbi:MAG: malate synthase [Nitrososphaeria archaeon]